MILYDLISLVTGVHFGAILLLEMFNKQLSEIWGCFFVVSLLKFSWKNWVARWTICQYGSYELLYEMVIFFVETGFLLSLFFFTAATTQCFLGRNCSYACLLWHAFTVQIFFSNIIFRWTFYSRWKNIKASILEKVV